MIGKNVRRGLSAPADMPKKSMVDMNTCVREQEAARNAAGSSHVLVPAGCRRGDLSPGTIGNDIGIGEYPAMEAAI
jgi:hypothetical protein